MKKILRKITALLISSAMAFSLCAPTYAVFTDPADIYNQYKAENNQPAQTDTLFPDDEEVKVTAETETETTAAAENTSKTKKSEKAAVKVPATDVNIYSYRTLIEVGESFRVGYKLKPSKSDDTVTYKSSNSKIASVDENGYITGKSAGITAITITASSGVKNRFTLTVKEPEITEDSPEDTDDLPPELAPDLSEATSIELKHNTVTLYLDDTYTIQYELTPKNCTDTVSYKSNNKAVASVDKKGVVTARGPGNTTIVCTTGSGAHTKLAVTVLNVRSEEQEEEDETGREYDENGVLLPSGVFLSEHSAGLMVGETYYLSANIYPAGATYTYELESDNPGVAKVSRSGKITAVSPGNAIITITTNNGKSDSIYVTVFGDVIKGIDVSKWNGDIDWKKVKNSGMANFAMIRASYGYEDTDPMLDKNVKGCEANGIPYGFYHYMYAKNVAEAKKEVAYFLNVIQDYSPTYPVVLDIEESFYKQMPKRDVTAIVTTFMEALEDAGYYAMIYSYAKFFDDNLIMDKIEKYDIWVACWGDKDKLAENYNYHYGMWQYSETGRIAGIDEYVDLNYSYKDYRATIIKYGLNKPTWW